MCLTQLCTAALPHSVCLLQPLGFVMSWHRCDKWAWISRQLPETPFKIKDPVERCWNQTPSLSCLCANSTNMTQRPSLVTPNSDLAHRYQAEWQLRLSSLSGKVREARWRIVGGQGMLKLELSGRRTRRKPQRRFMDAVKEDMQRVGVPEEDAGDRAYPSYLTARGGIHSGQWCSDANLMQGLYIYVNFLIIIKKSYVYFVLLFVLLLCFYAESKYYSTCSSGLPIWQGCACRTPAAGCFMWCMRAEVRISKRMHSLTGFSRP